VSLGGYAIAKKSQAAGITRIKECGGGHAQGWCAGNKKVHCQVLQSMDSKDPSWDSARSLQGRETGSYPDEEFTNIFPSFSFGVQLI